MLPHLTLGFPEPEVTWFKNASTIREDQRVRITKDNGTHTLLVEQATKADSGQYAIQVKNDKGREIRSFVVNVGPDDEKIVTQEVVMVHEVSEKSEVLEGAVDEFGVSVSLEAKEGREADLREKLEGTEKLIVVDTKVQEEDDADKTKKQKKKEVAVKKEVVTVHKVEEQVMEDGQVVREIRETVSSSELESGADVGLTEDSLHKLEPFVMMENRIQKPKIGGEESDEEVEEIIEVKKEIKVVHQVQERNGGQGEILDATEEVLSISEAKEVLESGVRTEKLEEVEKLIVIDNEATVIEDEDTSPKKKKQKIEPNEKDDSSVEVSTEKRFAESDVKTKERPKIAVEETVTVSEIPGKQRGGNVEENDEVLTSAPKPQPKKPWLESESETESDVESDVESDEPQKEVKPGDGISDVAEDLQQKMKKVEKQEQKKPWEASETKSDMESDEDMRSGKVKQKPKVMHPEEIHAEKLRTTEKKTKDKIEGKMVICVEGSEEAISMEEQKKVKLLASSEEITELNLKERKEKRTISADDIKETTEIRMKKTKKEEFQEKPMEKTPEAQEEPGSLEEVETGSSEEESYAEEEEEKEAAVTKVLIEQKKVKAKKEEVTVKEETVPQKTENIEKTVEQVQEQVVKAKVVTDETKRTKKQKKGEIIQTSEMSEEVLEATVEEMRKDRLLASAEETEETTELSLEEMKQRRPITSEESEEMVEMKMKKKKSKPQEKKTGEILPEEEEPMEKKPKEKNGEMVTSSEVREETIDDSVDAKRKAKLVATTDETEETTELTLDEKKQRGIITAEDSEDTVELTMKRKPKAALEREIKHEKDDEQVTTDEEEITEMAKPKKPWEVSDSESEGEFESEPEIEETRKEITDVISVQSRQDDKPSEYIATPEGLVQPQVEVVTETAPDCRASQEAPSFTLIPKPVSMVEGKTVKLTCRVKG